jgi:hypothetical protein
MLFTSENTGNRFRMGPEDPETPDRDPYTKSSCILAGTTTTKTTTSKTNNSNNGQRAGPMTEPYQTQKYKKVYKDLILIVFFLQFLPMTFISIYQLATPMKISKESH